MRAAYALVCAAGLASAAQLLEPKQADGAIVADEYVAVLKPGMTESSQYGMAMQFRANAYTIGKGASSFRALHAKMDATELQEMLDNPEVAYVEREVKYHIANSDRSNPRHAGTLQSPTLSCPDTQTAPLSYGTTRVTAEDEADVGVRFKHDASWGAGVRVYVLDTGVRDTHEEFGGRARFGVNFAGGSNTDRNGHGTHVAGTIAGATYGVAKSANIVSVKVLDDFGDGTLSGILNGVQWATNDANGRGIASMSLSGPRTQSLNDAVDAAVRSGLLVVVAAGNGNQDACNFSPASSTEAVSVGATTREDVRWFDSNAGPCVDMFAPGEDITSATFLTDDSIRILSGTSQAAPHVAGALAAGWQQNPDLSVEELKAWALNNALEGVVQNAGAGPNLLVHISCDGAGAPTAEPATTPSTSAPVSSSTSAPVASSTPAPVSTTSAPLASTQAPQQVPTTFPTRATRAPLTWYPRDSKPPVTRFPRATSAPRSRWPLATRAPRSPSPRARITLVPQVWKTLIPFQLDKPHDPVTLPRSTMDVPEVQFAASRSSREVDDNSVLEAFPVGTKAVEPKIAGLGTQAYITPVQVNFPQDDLADLPPGALSVSMVAELDAEAVQSDPEGWKASFALLVADRCDCNYEQVVDVRVTVEETSQATRKAGPLQNTDSTGKVSYVICKTRRCQQESSGSDNDKNDSNHGFPVWATVLCVVLPIAGIALVVGGVYVHRKRTNESVDAGATAFESIEADQGVTELMATSAAQCKVSYVPPTSELDV